MAKDFGIDNIVSHIKQANLLTPNRYEVIVNGPVVIPEQVLFNCHRCGIPAQSLGTFDHSIIGPIRKMPNQEIFDDLSTSFYLSEYIREMEVMHQWTRLIAGRGSGQTNSRDSYRIGYYNDFVADMVINIYNVAGQKTSSINIYEAYPVSISDVELSYAGTVPAEVTITWAYHSFEIETKQLII